MNYQLFEDLAHSLACVERNYELVREVGEISAGL